MKSQKWKSQKCHSFINLLIVLSITVIASLLTPLDAICVTIWPSSTLPGTVDSGPDSAVELGVKFKSDSDGYITGIRFYKASANTGTHVGNLWTNSGTQLATATFSNETASGWQQVNFSTPVAISANTIYVASYHTNTGHYSNDLNFFSSSGIDNPPIHALMDGVSGNNGVYAYGSSSGFPSNGWKSSNYWVDVVFSTTTADSTPPVVTSFTIPSSAATLTVSITSLAATDNVAVTGYMVTESTSTPLATDSGWSSAVPGSYTFATTGSKVLYAWAKDAAGNVSASMSATISITGQASVPEPSGWYAGDMHVHRSCGGSPIDLSTMHDLMTPQNLTFISLLADMGNGEVQNPATDLPRVTGQDDSTSTAGSIVHWDAEWHWDATYSQYLHQALGGHIVALGLTEAHQIWEEYTYPIFNWAHLQNGIAGFAHMEYLGDGFPQSLSCCTPVEYPVETALGSSDFISEDVVEMGNTGSGLYPENAIQAYYRLLNNGFRPGFAAGTDYPCTDGSALGSLLTYVQIQSGGTTYRNWIDGIAKGRTVVSRNGHNEFLDFTVNGAAGPGDEIKLTGSGSLPVVVVWTAIQNLTGTIELVQNGVVVASKQASAASGTPVTLNATVGFSKSGWLAARRMDSNGHVVHTAAVFVIVGNAPVRASATDAQFFVQWMDNLMTNTSAGGVWNAYFPTSLSAAQARYQAARSLYQQIALEAAGSNTATLASIAVTPSSQTVTIGSTQQFTATGTYTDVSTLNLTGQTTWSSSNPAIATIGKNGLVLGVSSGSTVISAKLGDVTSSMTLIVQVALPTITTTSLADATQNSAYSTTLAASGGTPPYTWTLASGTLPAGLTLNSSSGAINGTPTTTGSFSFTVQAADSGAPTQTATKILSIAVTAQSNYTIWPAGTVPSLVDAGADSAVELGVKFRSDAAGYITGIRFYKASANTGTHVGNLWSSTGTRLATAIFSNETASGWQQVNFSTPVAITANTVYVASYLCPAGHYSDTLNFFASAGIDNAPLHALADGVSGVNGVYSYGSSSTFPSNGWKGSNYWVDTVFTTTAPADTAPPTMTSFTVPATATTLTVSISSLAATDNVGVTGYLINESGTAPSASATGWTLPAPASYTFTTTGSKTLYAWAKDAVGNLSASLSAVVVITLDTTPPAVNTVVPASGATGTSVGSNLTAVFSEALDPSTIGSGTFVLRDSSNTLVSATVTYTSSTNTATLDPASTFQYSTTYTATIKGGSSGVKDVAGNPMASDFSWTFTTGPAPAPGTAPILIISSTSNPFSGFYVEILRTEGFNAFDVSDITAVTTTVLNSHDVAVLGDMTLTTSQVTMLTDWVNAGGKLIAMHPDKKLAGLLGLTDKGTTLSNAYLLVNTSSGPGVGIVNQTIQFHGSADRYTVNGASNLATLYSDANTTASDPAVTLNNVGASGGQAAAFTYDLARSIVYARQGNPAWAGQVRDGLSPIRSDDLFFGSASFDPQPDWVDLDKVAIPQADEQQRLLANLIIRMTLNKKPLPRFWYLPRSLSAAVIMTGDDHGSLYGGGATASRFDQFLADSPQGCVVDNWECVRGTAYLLPPLAASNPLTNSQAAAYVNAGFEIGVHADTSPDCSDWTPASLASTYTSDLNSFASVFTSVPAPATHRMHCISWSDYDSQPKTELSHGIRLDTNYYYYPSSWVNDRPGMFTGSGMPMRFTDASGNLIDVYQAATQMTDESGQSYPYTIDTLLDRAIGSEGYYGVFTVNAHNDIAASSVSDAVVSSALTRGIPVVTAKQMLTWLDGRNGSSFNSIAWNGSSLGFSINAAQGANGLTAMAPVPVGLTVAGITKDGSSIAFTTVMIKGIQYARFLAATGAYQVSYVSDVTPPTVTSVTPAAGATGVGVVTNPSATFSEDLDAATINTSTIELRDPSNVLVSATVAYNAATRTVTLTPAATLANSKTYTATIKGGASGVKDLAGNPLASDKTWAFTTIAASTGPYTIWPSTTIPGTVDAGSDNAVELGVKFRSDVGGYITGIRFYKVSTNTGAHVANLWTNSGALLATATFTNETASGWQQVDFATPVAITVNTVYVASYHCNNGHYSDDVNYFTGKGMDSPPLHALADETSGVNGVYAYGSSSNFPGNGWNSSNYWVDVVFQP